ncbi:nuclear hormone receptor FTZ-F1 beta isoform X2 [Daktulosphaira vitifoliae]|uniref:nuclear hormone receptor FTZ-F1 beta isoform X2 n=1 Tax=Daktulosphaira vitifoliae TaxID=58002 RepID=UPI0021AB05C4|nr:nuclear hormone receptor FTZ-F1 beta isoform X2 [Daktulosphaira vitifoliae]
MANSETRMWGHSVVSSGPVTVTSINLIAPHLPNTQITTIKEEPHDRTDGMVNDKKDYSLDDIGSECDREVSKIDFSGVTMRSKKMRAVEDNMPRPMSWEGELSDLDVKQDDDDDDANMDVQAVNQNYLSPKQESLNNHGSRGKLIGYNEKNLVDRVMEHVKSKVNSSSSEIPLLVDQLLGGEYSPLLQHKTNSIKQPSHIPPTQSPDSAIHSCCSPVQSPITSRHNPPSSSGFSSPSTFTPSSLSRNNSDASQYGGSQHSSCYSQSYSSVSVSPTQFSPSQSPIQPRHIQRNFHEYPVTEETNGFEEKMTLSDIGQQHSITSGISRQQLINSPCPICGDKISGFHYGIFSCESCKGFFKRTVQNHKNYVCLHGSACLITIATRKKCPACRFDKCLNMGMKLEAIRVDRTRGGRSTYPFTYTIPQSNIQSQHGNQHSGTVNNTIDNKAKQEDQVCRSSPQETTRLIPQLLQEIMEVEHLWTYNEGAFDSSNTNGSSSNHFGGAKELAKSRLMSENKGTDFLSNLCNIADHRLYKIVKWCKSLPLFKNISIDDQISLLINAWCELLLFSCCYRSVSSPGEIRVSLGKSISLEQAKDLGLAPCIERMLNFTQHLRRLRVDRYEYVAMKVIVLLSSDTNDLKEPEKVRASQEKALHALQQYTIAHYPDMPSKFGELLLRIPDLQRTCQVGKEMLSIKSKEGEGQSFNLLMELLRGDH